MANEINVLHVDDDPSITDLTATFLERENDRFTVETTTNADEALKSVNDGPPDCVVSDYNMPEMDGLEFLQAVREDNPDLPFILYTGKGSETVASRAIAANVTDYLQKGSGSEQYELLANRIRNAVQARRDAERATRQEQLMRLTEFAGDTGGFELDREGETILLTVGARRIIGRPDQPEISQTEAVELFHPDDREEIKHTLSRAFETGEEMHGTYRIQPDGDDERLLDLGITPIMENGEITKIRGVFHDITTRRERRREMRLLQQAIDDANVSITLADPSRPDEALVYVNDAFEEMTGYPPAETLGRSCWFLRGEDTDPEKVAALRDAIDTEQPVSVELRNYRRDGTEFWNRVTVAPIYGNDGRLVRYLGTQEDITERKERERELERTQNLMTDMEELADIGAWKYDPNTGELTNTAGARRIYGGDLETGLSVEEAFEFYQPKDRERLRTCFNECLETGEPYEIDVRLTTTEGAQRWVTARGERVDTSGPDGAVRGYIQDITEEKTRERQLTELNRIMRDLSTAETQQEVFDIGVTAAKDVLDLQANAIHLSEDDDTSLTPVAHTDKLSALVGDVPSLPVADSIAGRVYRRGEPTIVEDVRKDRDVHDPDTKLRGHAYLPLADYGVLIAGSEEPSSFDRQHLAIGELLAGNLVATLDRIDREQAASRQQQQLSLFFDESPLGAIQWDGDFRFERLNDRAEEILGYGEAELRGESWEAIVAEEDRDHVEDVVADLLAVDGGTHVINENVTQNGETKTCKWHNRAVTDADSGVRTIISKFEDVTKQKERKRELTRYERLIENLPIGVFRTTIDGEIIDMNEAVTDIYNAESRAQLREVGAEELYLDDSDRDELLGRLQETDRIENELIEFETLDGDRRFVRTTLTLNEEGENGYLEGVLQDVTDRHELEREFAQIKTIAESLNDAVYVIDEHGRFTYVNSEFVELTGYSEETVLGSTSGLIKDEETVREAERQLGRLLSEGGPDTVTFETTIHPRSDDPVVCEDHMGVLPYEGDSFNGSVGMLRDISERKRREQELRRERDRLDEFASVVSHDLRNPLSVAQGNLGLLAAECDTDRIEQVEQAHARMNDLIDDLLTLAREGDVVSDMESVTLEEVAETCWRTVESPDASLRAESTRALQCDPSRIRQLLENLYRNAVEHGGPDVAVTVGEVDDGFYVEDDGPGIPEDEREQVFEPGYSTAEEGTGFGLRIVKQVAEAHGWTVQATKNDAGGARFEITGVEFSQRGAASE